MQIDGKRPSDFDDLKIVFCRDTAEQLVNELIKVISIIVFPK